MKIREFFWPYFRPNWTSFFFVYSVGYFQFLYIRNGWKMKNTSSKKNFTSLGLQKYLIIQYTLPRPTSYAHLSSISFNVQHNKPERWIHLISEKKIVIKIKLCMKNSSSPFHSLSPIRPLSLTHSLFLFLQRNQLPENIYSPAIESCSEKCSNFTPTLN